MGSHENSGRLVDVALYAHRVVALNRSVNLIDVRRFVIVNFLDPRRADGRRDGFVDFAVRGPIILLVEQCPFHRLKLAEFRGGICKARGLHRVWMHVEREIAMHDINLARVDIIVDHLLERQLVKSAASRALGKSSKISMVTGALFEPSVFPLPLDGLFELAAAGLGGGFVADFVCGRTEVPEMAASAPTKRKIPIRRKGWGFTLRSPRFL